MAISAISPFDPRVTSAVSFITWVYVSQLVHGPLRCTLIVAASFQVWRKETRPVASSSLAALLATTEPAAMRYAWCAAGLSMAVHPLFTPFVGGDVLNSIAWSASCVHILWEFCVYFGSSGATSAGVLVMVFISLLFKDKLYRLVQSMSDNEHIQFHYKYSLYQAFTSPHGESPEVLQSTFQLLAWNPFLERRLVGRRDGRMLYTELHPLTQAIASSLPGAIARELAHYAEDIERTEFRRGEEDCNRHPLATALHMCTRMTTPAATQEDRSVCASALKATCSDVSWVMKQARQPQVEAAYAACCRAVLPREWTLRTMLCITDGRVAEMLRLEDGDREFTPDKHTVDPRDLPPYMLKDWQSISRERRHLMALEKEVVEGRADRVRAGVIRRMVSSMMTKLDVLQEARERDLRVDSRWAALRAVNAAMRRPTDQQIRDQRAFGRRLREEERAARRAVMEEQSRQREAAARERQRAKALRQLAWSREKLRREKQRAAELEAVQQQQALEAALHCEERSLARKRIELSELKLSLRAASDEKDEDLHSVTSSVATTQVRLPKPTQHLAERAEERGVTPLEMQRVLKRGDVVREGESGSLVMGYRDLRLVTSASGRVGVTVWREGTMLK